LGKSRAGPPGRPHEHWGEAMDQHIPHPHIPHIPHPHIELRKLHWKKHKEGSQDFNSWLAVRITAIVGTMWCAYAFAALALISLPAAYKAGTATLVAWFAQTFLQLVLLSIIMVGQKVAAAKSDRQLEQTYQDAEAILQINDDMHRLVKQNVDLTGQIDQVLRQNMELTEQINKLICHAEKKEGGEES
jgi:ABC-type nickel/cobalt efflux system permease component RcnA